MDIFTTTLNIDLIYNNQLMKKEVKFLLLILLSGKNGQIDHPIAN